MASTVYVACTRDAQWPPEVWAVFGTEDAARERVERALWAFRVEPLPVYTSYGECPAENRGVSGELSAIGEQAGLRLRDGGVIPGANARPATRSPATPAAAAPPAWGDSSGVAYAVCGRDDDGAGYVEVQLFCRDNTEARKHVDAAYCMAGVLPLVVYGTYAQCPPDRRYDNSRGLRPSSLCMQLRQPAG